MSPRSSPAIHQIISLHTETTYKDIHQSLEQANANMCKERTEKWVCKHCEKPVKEIPSKIKCQSLKETGRCKEWVNAKEDEIIDMYDPDCTFCNEPRSFSKQDLEQEIRPWKWAQ